MRGGNLGGRHREQGSAEVGHEALSVVQEDSGRPLFTRVVAAVTPEWSEDDWTLDFDESTAQHDDAFWAYVVMVRPFSWQWYLNWWAARRYVQPRDVRRR